MKFQNKDADVSPYLLVILTILTLIAIAGVTIFGSNTSAEPVAELEPIASPIVIEEIAGECDVETMMVMPDADTTAADYQEQLYKFKGERIPVTLTKKINDEQADLLIYAYEVAQVDGHKEPAVLQGLIWQESKAGGFPGYEVAGDEYGLNVGHRYYGVGQIKVAAARDVFKRFPEDFPDFVKATDEYIIAHLIMDKKFNIRVASKYLWMMQHKEKSKKVVLVRPTNYAITAYNRGLGNTYDTDYNNWHYTVSVHKHKDTFIKKFNLANNKK